MSSLVNRMKRAAMLDRTLYDEVKTDKGLMQQAVIVVLISSIIIGIGMFGLYIYDISNPLGYWIIPLGIISNLIGWIMWSFVTYIIGVKVFPEPQTKADFGTLLRTVGFSNSPGVFAILAFVPIVGTLFFYLVIIIWMLVATVIAVRQALDYTNTWRAIGVCVLAYVVINLVAEGLIKDLILMPMLLNIFS